MYYGEFDLKRVKGTKSLMMGEGDQRLYSYCIFIITECIKNNLFLKQINCAEYKYVNYNKLKTLTISQPDI